MANVDDEGYLPQPELWAEDIAVYLTAQLVPAGLA
jgi:hypothetical protein